MGCQDFMAGMDAENGKTTGNTWNIKKKRRSGVEIK